MSVVTQNAGPSYATRDERTRAFVVAGFLTVVCDRIWDFVADLRAGLFAMQSIYGIKRTPIVGCQFASQQLSWPVIPTKCDDRIFRSSRAWRNLLFGWCLLLFIPRGPRPLLSSPREAPLPRDRRPRKARKRIDRTPTLRRIPNRRGCLSRPPLTLSHPRVGSNGSRHRNNSTGCQTRRGSRLVLRSGLANLRRGQRPVLAFLESENRRSLQRRSHQ